MKKHKIIIKITFFFVIFAFLTQAVAFILKDDTNSYSRTLTHEFYNQKQIDIVFCGASHVSHGIDPRISDKEFNANTFNLGTPSQGINGTYAIIEQAIKSYDIKKVYLEADFAVACKDGPNPPQMGKADFIVSSFLKNSSIKRQFIFENSSVTNIINAVLPIGKDKLMTLNPKKIVSKIKMIINRSYFDYSFGDSDSGYAGKGCVLNFDFIENGSFSNDHIPPQFKCTTEYWRNYIRRIVNLCKENNVELVFYSMPCSDFYLHEKGDYDFFYNEVKNFFAELGYDYYDFNLCKSEYAMDKDEYYSDDNHLNIKGIERYSHVFCDFFTGKTNRNDVFYNSYSEKCSNQAPSVYGLIIIKSENGSSFDIIPMKNNFDESRITYDVDIISNKNVTNLAEKTKLNHFELPQGTSGKINVKCYIDDKISNNITENYVAF